jgi:hypothetical protein
MSEKNNKVIHRKDVHAVLELVLDTATYKQPTGTTKFSIPYYDLVENPKNFKPIFLEVEIITSWNTEEVEAVFLHQDEEESEDPNDKKNRTSSKSEKH